MKEQTTLNVGFIGAGYIASWHANALANLKQTRLVAVCDPNIKAAKALAAQWHATAYRSLDDMLEHQSLQAVHVLSPPNLHCKQTILSLNKGCHVLVEKPFAVTTAEAESMHAASTQAGKVVAVNHNFLALSSYQRMKEALRKGMVGKIHRLEANWHYPLAQIRSGPFGIWMLRSSANLLREIGPHLFAFVQDLLGPMTISNVIASKSIQVPGVGSRPQSFSIFGHVGHTAVQLSISLVESYEDRSLTLHGVTGRAKLDFASDTFVLHQGNTSDIVLNPLMSAFSIGIQYIREGFHNAWVQGLSLNRKTPYALSMEGAVAAFYDVLQNKISSDDRFSAEAGTAVSKTIDGAVGLLSEDSSPHTPQFSIETKESESIRGVIVVIGGTGFIGRSLTRRLVRDGYRVRVFSRGSNSPFGELGDLVEMVPVDLSDADGMAVAMMGSTAVYHLAKTEGRTWDDYLENDVRVTEQIAKAALKAGIHRFVYTGTIASYDASDKSKQIDETTPFGPMESRQLYGRSKAACEQLLLTACKTQGLPLVIARPGIVIGPGGPLQHWGIGRWSGSSAVKLWGSGENPIPLVLIDDVTDALVRMLDKDGIIGESFNLVADANLSAIGYFDAIFRLTGTRIKADPGNLELMFAAEWIKYLLKRYALRRSNLSPPSRADCRSRAHYSKFSNQKAKKVLQWTPLEDSELLMRTAILQEQFFGY